MFNQCEWSKEMRQVLVAFWLTICTVSIVVGDDAVVPEKPKEIAPVLLQMMRNDSVHDHLHLDPATRKAIHTTLDAIDGPWWRSRLLGDSERKVEIGKLTEALRAELRERLSVTQLKRVEQLELQALLGDADKSRIEKMSRQEVLATYGQPFDFATVKRTLPRAPELIDNASGSAASGNWLSGDAKTLAGLRGKVVAVHFYAFQCINCVRNLPHYKSWHDDLAAKGVVVIGIQTPETQRERDVAAVRTAAKQSAIDYSVLMDPGSENWKTWGNTMWPTVYLIDKEGYIRHWWQGELNWQETKGERAMRDNIMKLLAE